jgi:hypothetical protein
MSRLLPFAGAALLITACAPVPVPPLTGDLSPYGPGGSTLTIDDEHRYVTSFTLSPYPERPSQLTVSNPDGDPMTLRVSWVGGICRLDATIAIRSSDDGIRLAVNETPCVADAGRFRSVDLHLKEAIPAEAVDVVETLAGS